MAQDLKTLFENEIKASNEKMPEGHEARFLEKLNQSSPVKTNSKKWLSVLQIAASVLLLIGLAIGVYTFTNQSKLNGIEIVDSENTVNDNKMKSLGDISPGLKQVEDYYLANINLELSKVKQTSESKELFEGYVIRLAELNQEYKRLSVELTKNGPNELTVSALIDNLKLRLNLLYRLKEQLNDLNTAEVEQMKT